MPNGNGHYHAYSPVRAEVELGVSPENVSCGYCLGFRDEPVHTPPAVASATSRTDRVEALGAVGLLVKCPDCGAQLGQRCFNQNTHQPIHRSHANRVKLQRRLVVIE